MARHKREAKGKVINPTFFVFCEGESEAAYINHLKNSYRKPVVIIPKVTKNKVSVRFIKESIKSSFGHEKDRVYLVYDIDVAGFHEKLLAIQKEIVSILIISNPCFELWYLLHFTNQTAEISTDHCIKKLENVFKSYQKGIINTKLLEKLGEKKSEAIHRAKSLLPPNNPSTNIHLFIEELERIKDVQR